jgi:hypothetical protein
MYVLIYPLELRRCTNERMTLTVKLRVEYIQENNIFMVELRAG